MRKKSLECYSYSLNITKAPNFLSEKEYMKHKNKKINLAVITDTVIKKLLSYFFCALVYLKEK